MPLLPEDRYPPKKEDQRISSFTENGIDGSEKYKDGLQRASLSNQKKMDCSKHSWNYTVLKETTNCSESWANC